MTTKDAGEELLRRLEEFAAQLLQRRGNDSGYVPCLDADCADAMTGAIQEIGRLQSIVEKLPKTADGVPIVPGMKVYSPKTKTLDTEDGAFVIGKVGDGPGWFYGALMKEACGLLFSTRAAALSAAAAPGEGK